MPYQDMGVGGNLHGSHRGYTGGRGNADWMSEYDMIRNANIYGNPLGPTAAPAAQDTGFDFGGFKSAGLWGANQAADLASGMNTYSPQYSQAYKGIKGVADQFGRRGTRRNPFEFGMASFGDRQNEYLGDMFDIASSRIQDRVNSQFGLAGRPNSGMHVGNMTRELGDFGTNFFGSAFDNQMNRELNALQSGASIFDNWQNRQQQGLQGQLSAYGMMPGMLDSRMNAQFAPLQNYASILSQLQGTQPPPQQKKDSFDQLIALGGLLL